MPNRKEPSKKVIATLIVIVAVIIAAYIWVILALANGPVNVKYRTNGPVNIHSSNFESLNKSDSDVGGAWYDSSQKYMVIELNGTYYQYCGMPADTWDWLKSVDSPYAYYQTDIRGNFDCRVNYVPSYD